MSLAYNQKKKLTEPKDMLRRDKLSVILFRQSTLDDIFKKCLPKAEDSEFQIHYRSLNFHCTKYNIEVVFTVPTVFYNFKQEVDTSSVEYELPDITKAAELVKPLSAIQINEEYVKDLHSILKKQFDSVKVIEIADNSCHRHPSNFGFSSIDYDKDPEEPGVIYRKAKCTNIYQTDSVLYWNGNEAQVVVTETKIVTVNKAKDGGVEGEYVEIPTITYIQQDREKDIIATQLTPLSRKEEHISVMNKIALNRYKEIEEIIEEVEFNIPNIDMIVPEYITQTTGFLRGYDVTHKNYNAISYKKKESYEKDGYGYHIIDYDDDEEEEYSIALEWGYNLSCKEEKAEWDAMKESIGYVQ